MKSRDYQRQGDIKKIQAALEDYYADHRTYPNSGGWITIGASGGDLLSNMLSGSYINVMPMDPVGQGGAEPVTDLCDDDVYDYFYNSNGSTYTMKSQMEVSSSAGKRPCSDIPGLCTDVAGCYAVRNP